MNHIGAMGRWGIRANNLMTIGALRALRARGLRVPDDIALVAIDDPFWAELVDPPITTLAQPIQRMTEGAVEEQFDRIQGNGGAQTKCLVYSFEPRARGSCDVRPWRTSSVVHALGSSASTASTVRLSCGRVSCVMSQTTWRSTSM